MNDKDRRIIERVIKVLSNQDSNVDIYGLVFRKNALIDEKLSALMSCSILQASLAATSGVTPKDISQSESTACRSYIVSAHSRPDSVNEMHPESEISMRA